MSPPRPTRSTVSGRAYLDLQNLARRARRPSAELHQLYVLECFLDRLARSAHADHFVLKGGVLLAAYDMRRPTRDVDLRADRLTSTPEAVLDAVAAIAVSPVDDGAVFNVAAAHAETIRDEDVYNGVRVTMPASGRRGYASSNSTTESRSPSAKCSPALLTSPLLH